MSWKDEILAVLEKHFGGTNKPTPEGNHTHSIMSEEGAHSHNKGLYSTSVAKSVDVEKRHFTAVVLRPNEVDLHGDIYDEQCVEEACHQYNEICRKANIQHLIQTELATPIESYIAKADFTLGDGQVKAGDWVLTLKIKDDELWGMCKDGTFTGLSVGCTASIEQLV